jgi:hypothetical protein
MSQLPRWSIEILKHLSLNLVEHAARNNANIQPGK